MERMHLWRDALHILLVCAGIALAPVIPYAWRSPWIGWPAFLQAYATGLVFSLAIGIPAQIWFGRVWIAVRRLSWPLRWLVIGAIAVALTLAGVAVGCAVLAAFGLFHWQNFGRVYLQTARSALIITFVFGGLVAAYEQMKHRLESANHQLRRKEEERERAVKLALEARLASLESRVHPHFLFNTLNSISALIASDPARAEQLVGRLAALLRYSLDASQTGPVPLAEELKIVRDYLDIESARFADRLSFRIAAPEDLGEFAVPALSIQTLVENSIKHAVAPSRAGARIEVSVCRESSGGIRVEVADNGPGFSRNDMRFGHGLEQLEARLNAYYGDTAGLSIGTESGMSRVVLEIPEVRVAEMR